MEGGSSCLLDENIMVEPKLLRKAQLRMVDILKEIDRICQKYDIKWCLRYGTLLGAVRHKGFIPWDDDCDISMMRDGYEKFVSVIDKELGSEFFFQTKETDPSYPGPMAKIRLRGTKLVEFDEEDNMPYNQGVFVDIFILDYYPSCAKNILPLFKIMPNLRAKRKQYPRGSVMRAVLGVLTGIPYFFHSCGEKLFKFYCKPLRTNSTMPYIGDDIRVNPGIVIKKEDVFPLSRDIEFEGCYFPVFNHPEVALELQYGDFMEIPPPEKRHIHAKAIEL